MNKKIVTASILVGGLIAGSAQAALHDRGGGLIYDDVLDVTWLQNANYAGGMMSFVQAQTWAGNLSYYDSVRHITYTDWRLPTVTDKGRPGCNSSNFGTDCGYNVDTATGEMAYMFYTNLGNLAALKPTGFPQAGSGLKKTGSFINLQAGVYWYGTEVAGSNMQGLPTIWTFDFSNGWQGTQNQLNSQIYAWAVRDGDVIATSVPEPETYAMMLAGLGLVGFMARRRKQAEA